MPTIDIRDNTAFQKELKDAKERLVVVDFHAVWCGPCKAIAPVYASLSEKFKATTTFLRVDVDQCQDIAKSAKVEAMPSFGFYHKGRLLELFKGADPSKLEATIARLSAAHAKTAFTGSGNSMVGGGGGGGAAAAGRGAPSVAAAAPASAKRERKNPWADANFVENKMKVAKSETPKVEEPKKASPPSSTGAVASHTSSTPLRGVAATGGMPSGGTTSSASSGASTGTPTATPAVAAPSAVAAAARTPASGNDSQLKVNHSLLTQLLSFGYTQVRSEKALISTQNRNIEAALNWLIEHEGDRDIDEPWTVVATPAATATSATAASSAVSSAPLAAAATTGVSSGDATATPTPASTTGSDVATPAAVAVAPVKFDDDDDVDPGMKAILAEVQKRKDAEAAAAVRAANRTQDAPSGPERKKIADMTSEEKKAWYMERVELGKQKRQNELIEREKVSEKSRREITHAAADMKEAQDKRLGEQIARQKKKDEADARKVRERTREKINLAKAERKRQAEYEAAELAKQKAAGGPAKKA